MRLGESVRYRGLGTVEFLTHGDRFAFIEVNPRLQVEHTITEEVTGVDLVRTQIRLAAGATLAELGLTQEAAPTPRGTALQARITLGHTDEDGATTPAAGTLTAYELPSGRGIRVDGAGYVGYRTSLRYDPLLAKLIVSDAAADLGVVAARARPRAERGEHRRRRDERRRPRRDRRLPRLRRGRAAPPTSSTTTAQEILAAARPHRFVEVRPRPRRPGARRCAPGPGRTP